MTLYIFDSDHLSLYQRGHEALRQQLLTVSPDQIAITVITAEELIRGRLTQIRKANQPQSRIRAYQWFIRTLEFLRDFTITLIINTSRRSRSRYEATHSNHL